MNCLLYLRRFWDKSSHCNNSLPFNSAVQSSKPFSALQELGQSAKTIQFKGKRVLDIVASKPNVANNCQSHLRLVQDFLRTNPIQLKETQIDNETFHPDQNENSISILYKLHKRGLSIDPSVLSNALSICGSERALRMGIQFHCLVFVNGFISNIYVGSSLISFYGKCGILNDAYKMFDEMPLKNVVSWTAMINGFAQENQVDRSLQLYNEMRNLKLKPNDFTFTSFLSLCTACGSLGQGRSIHCQTIHLGFDSHIHIANALISMYCKCGNIEDAFFIFRNIDNKDLVSWNSMIAAYALHGLAMLAIELLERMKKKKVKPDAITFLGILSSCRHAGLVKHGKSFFNLMAKYGVKPGLDHYSSVVDLLGRAGLVEEAMDFIKRMPISPNAVIWGSLISSCRLHGNLWVGIEAAENRLVLEPSCAATHLQLANLYAGVGYWDDAARVRKAMKDKGLKTDPGYSWIEIKNETYEFRAEDRSNLNVIEILSVLEVLVDHMRAHGQSHLLEEIACLH
ncbi:hypothetical protein M9H77_03277 [Catharanthus roseus]|uniref:Uncharacterized protein n=1 Tax=Catharanthus roseus TaxID=4058 RepID=A0ACC0CB87_CATRO|nr:hypothetical protein M9H77_03277 [Catharanthus roseus]